MSKPIVLNIGQWEKLRSQLKKDYNPSVVLIRDRMKSKLGFVDREHRWYTLQHGYQTHICLDFYDEPKRTMFLLKYGEYLEDR